MQLTRIVRAFGLFLVLGVGGSVVGCGSGAQQGALAEQKDAGKIRSEGHRALHQQVKEGAKSTGNSRPKSGP
jgi:hypothetical protein